MKKCCIVIVTHKETLDDKDELSFKRCLEVFGDKRDIKLVLPDNISTEYYDKYTNVLEILKVNNKWLSSLKEYNKMCCNKDFWNLFTNYEYVLIYQTDCWLFEDNLDYFIEMGYDYYGAPWMHNNDAVGNGGLSLRKVSKMIEITSKYEFKGESLEGAEDTWFSINHKDEINICPLDAAVNFSIENPTRKYLEKIGKLPMGLHGRNAYGLWDSDGTKLLELKKKSKMYINFITFANTDSNFSQERIIFEARRMDIFNDITFYTEKDFDEEFMNRCGKEFPNFRRGYGYWSWKPYIIKKELEKINDGDVVVYADSGCMFKSKNRKVLKEWINIVKNSESGILSPCFGPYIEHDWTRGDLYDYINKTYNKDNVDIFDKAIQCGATVLLFKKNEKSVDFVNQWYDVMTNHFHLCTDEPSSLPNHPNFRENRHDQSVFSMLSKIYNIETIETANGILDRENSPIIATRCKNDKNTWKKPIDILFDSQIYDLQKFGGISRMYSDIANELNKNEIVERYTGNGITNGKYQDFYARFSIGNTDNAYLKDVYCDNDSPSNRNISVNEIKKGDFDVFYPTFFSPYFLDYIGDKPFVMSVHDMIPEIYSEYFSRNDMQIVGKKEMVKYASAIEVPSQTTKRDLMRILGVDERKIHVVGRALSPEFGRRIYSKSIVDYDYILYVGQRNAYKRFDWFIKHITPFLENHKDMHIICTGNRFTDSEIEMFKKYEIDGRVHTIFADDLTMATLYKYAKFFVFSSEYEGFGLPVLESYKMGCIALLNNNEVFNEITDGMGTFFDLHKDDSNLSEVAEKIYSLTDEEKNKILNKQYSILEKYSSEKYFGKIKEMINEVLKIGSRKVQNNLDIYICTHKDFKPIVKNKAYKIINSNDINNDSWNGLKGSFYSEIMSYFYIAKNYKLKDYIGFCSYRKYFSFMDDIPNMDEVFSENDIIIAKPKPYGNSVRQFYSDCHNIEDLNIIENIVKEKYPDYYNVFERYMNQKMFIQCNMFIMKREDFLKYIDFIDDILNEYIKIVGTDIEKRIEDNKDKYLKKNSPNNTVEYQYRIGGYLAERLTGVFILKNFKKARAYEIKITEKKY